MRELSRFQRWGAVIVWSLALVLSPAAIWAAGQTAYPVFAGLTTNGLVPLPLKVVADADTVTGHLVVDAGTGFGTTATVNFPYPTGPAAATAASALVSDCVFNTVLPTVASTQVVGLQCDSSGRLITASTASITLPFTGGATGVANAASQGLAIFAYNGATNDALQESGGSLNVRYAATPGVNIASALPTGANTIGVVTLGAGSAIAGKVGIDQTTPGTTNLVQIGGTLPAFAAPPTVTLSALPALVASVGTRIGTTAIDQTTPGTTNGVQVTAALPTGTNTIGNVGTAGATNLNIPIATGANTIVKASAGVCHQILVIAQGTVEMDFYDNSTTNTGTKVAIIPANANPGSIVACNSKFAAGLTSGGSASNPGVVVMYD